MGGGGLQQRHSQAVGVNVVQLTGQPVPWQQGALSICGEANKSYM